MPDEGVYVDTSVLGAYYCPEPSSAAAERALLKLTAPVISVLSEVEFSSLISRKRRLKELSERHAKEILALFESHVAEGFYSRMFLTTAHFLKARQLVGSADGLLCSLDALHLAAAITESLTIMTADRNLAKAAKRHRGGAMLIE
jgi:uncharacterized protein